jgi:hypothetical protein
MVDGEHLLQLDDDKEDPARACREIPDARPKGAKYLDLTVWTARAEK